MAPLAYTFEYDYVVSMSKVIFHRIRVAILWGLLAVGALIPAPTSAAELVMFERPGCSWCARWNREVAPIYSRSEEGKAAPLRRIDLSTGVPPDLEFIAPVRFTPTFVLVDNGREVGRLTGYMGEDAFWGLLAGLLRKAQRVDASEARLCFESECP